MATYGVTSTGFKLKRFQEILISNRQKAIEIFQDLVPPGETVDTSDSSVLGRLINLLSDGASDLWEAAQQDYTAFDVNSATGVPLDNITALGGVTRFGESKSVAPVILSGNIATAIPGGSQVSSSTTGNRFLLAAGVLISSENASAVWIGVTNPLASTVYKMQYGNISFISTFEYTSSVTPSVSEILLGLKSVIDTQHVNLIATVEGTLLKVARTDSFQVVNFVNISNLSITRASNIGDVIAESPGPVIEFVNSITTINTPVLGWDSVTNPSPTTPGRIIETDEELRLRFRSSKAERAVNSVEAVYSAIRALDNVSQVIIYENETDFINQEGVLPHSIMPVVVGSDVTSIVKAIWENKPIGIKSQGNTQGVVVDSGGVAHAIGFERPVAKEFVISILLVKNAKFPVNGELLIRNAIVEYVNKEFGIGQGIIYSRLFTPINSVPGHEVRLLGIGDNFDTLSDQEVFVPETGIGFINPENILIEVI